MLSPYMSPVERVWFYSLRILCGLVLLFLILPVLVIVPLSFNSGSFLVYPLQGFSLQWYQDFFGSAEWMRALKNSIIVAPAATVLAMVFGTLAAIGLTRGDFPGKSLVMALVISPMVVPVVIIGVASYLFFAPLGMGNSFTSLILVHAVLGVPFVIITVSATLQGFNYNLVRAAAAGCVAAAGLPSGDPAADCARGDLGCAVCLCDVVRRGGGDTVPGRAGAGDPAAADVQWYPRKPEPHHCCCGDLADCVLGGVAADPGVVAWAQREAENQQPA